MMIAVADRPLPREHCIDSAIQRLADKVSAELRAQFGSAVAVGDMQAAQAMSLAIDAKDPATRGHGTRVARFSVRLAQALGLSEDQLTEIHLAGLLHDIGKMAIEERLLQKPERLTHSEYERIKLHPLLGYRILRGVEQLAGILPAVLYHHEQWDGGGYPSGLAGSHIPQIARIVAVADAYDAMTSDRPYRHRMPLVLVQRVFQQGGGVFWDPRIIEAYFRMQHELADLAASGRSFTPA